MKLSTYYTILLLALASLAIQTYVCCTPPPVDARAMWGHCADWCETMEPGDRGQSCIDVKCNPLLAEVQ